MKKILLAIILCCCSTAAYTEKPDYKLQDIKCIAANMFFEARNQGLAGMQAVGDVTINRVKSKRYPASVCAVVFQRWQFTWTHYTNNRKVQNVMLGIGKGLSVGDREALKLAHELAERTVFENSSVLLPETVLHYHADYVKPKWAKKMQKYTKIVKHVFYIDKPSVK
jgi:spore germination cell wall hydrolase CwlJ-like protein